MSAATERALRDQTVLSPAAKRVLAFLDARAGRTSSDTIGPEINGRKLAASDLRALVRDQDDKYEFWAETEQQKRIIAALVEIIDGPRVEQAPLVAASRHAIQAQIDTRARRDEALRQARWIASEFPADCGEDGCTVAGGKCLDCGQGATL